MERGNKEECSSSFGRQQYATFYVGDLMFGIDVVHVQEVIRSIDMTPVPLAASIVQGLVNLRGQIITAIDLRKRLLLNAEERGEEDLPMNVVVNTGEEIVSLLVDEIGDVLEVEESQYEPPPATLDRLILGLVRGVYKLQDDLLLVLNTECAIDVTAVS